MITFKQFEKDEHWAITVIIKFIRNHPFTVLLLSSAIILFIISVLSIVMMMAIVGGGYVENHFNEQFASGQITHHEYNLLTMGMGMIFWCYNFIDALVGFIVGLIILIWTYIGFKEYLRYNRDNL